MTVPKTPKRVLYGAFRLIDDELAIPCGELQITERAALSDIALLAARGVTAVLCEVTIKPKDPR